MPGGRPGERPREQFHSLQEWRGIYGEKASKVNFPADLPYGAHSREYNSSIAENKPDTVPGAQCSRDSVKFREFHGRNRGKVNFDYIPRALFIFLDLSSPLSGSGPRTKRGEMAVVNDERRFHFIRAAPG